MLQPERASKKPNPTAIIALALKCKSTGPQIFCNSPFGLTCAHDERPLACFTEVHSTHVLTLIVENWWRDSGSMTFNTAEWS
jgi:hypothetical protein